MAATFLLPQVTGGCRRILYSTGLILSFALGAGAQSTKPATPVKPPVPTVEPGLETAVKWRWTPEASDPAVWGLSLEAPPQPSTTPGSPSAPGSKASPVHPQGPPEQTLDYAIQKGDSLYVIAKRHGVTVDQLKLFNQMKSDRIVIGQTLRIPSLTDLKAMQPPPPPPEPEPKKKDTAVKKAVPVPEKKPEDASPEKNLLLKRPLPSAASTVARIVLMQAYLDRQGFSAGPIDGSDGPLYEAATRSYEATHPGVLTSEMGQVPEALKKLGGAFTEYQLTRDDLRWIEPPAPVSSGRKKAATPEPPLTLESLTAVPFLPYRTAWEFVAERFHCSESFLRRINPGLKSPITAGALFFVPNVLPFEIENALQEPLQPTADPAAPVTATIVANNRLEIRRSGQLIANLPVSVARPGLRGRGAWKVLNAIPRPKMTSTGDAAAPLASPITLPPGPNNPVGPIWINLAKAKEGTPLPYGLHGTSIPGYMTRQESIGGFRMTNWDIARVVRLLPVDTPLNWQ